MNTTKKRKISSGALRNKFFEDSGKLHPNNVYRGYCIGYRRALRDKEKKNG
jgi:hypothetical protein